MLRCPLLTSKHKADQSQWAKAHDVWHLEDRAKLFSLTRKNNLDAPESITHYWHDLRRKERIMSKRQVGGASLMIWGAVYESELFSLDFICGN